MPDYRVNLDIFAGPMDLLLYLVRKEEVDIYDIPIAKVTNQYLQYVEMLKKIDIDLAGDFLVTAAALMQIKSAMLLPKAEPEDFEGQADDPRTELIKQLLEYKKFKDAANLLGEAVGEQKLKHHRPDTIIERLKPTHEPEVDIDQVSIWDLLEAFDAIMKATGSVKDFSHIKDDTPIDLYQIQVLHRLQDDGPMTFRRLFEDASDRIVMVGLFLALLELIREGLIWAQQEKPDNNIYVKSLTDLPPEQAVRRAVLAVEEEQETDNREKMETGNKVPIKELPPKTNQKIASDKYQKTNPRQ